MWHVLTFVLPACGLGVAMLLLLEAGRRIGIWRRRKNPDGADKESGAVDAAIFGLMGLLIAFTFSGAASRFDERRHLIVQEANAIGTFYLRLDLLPADSQGALREKMRQYVDARLAFYRKLSDQDNAEVEMARSAALQLDIWRAAVAGSRGAGLPSVMTLVLSAANDVIDITTTRGMALKMHPPPIIFAMLAVLVLVSSLLAGYGMAANAKRNWLHMLIFAGMMSMAVYVILDLEYPRFGLIRVDATDQVLVDLRQSFK
jgi:hypothetical protein